MWGHSILMIVYPFLVQFRIDSAVVNKPVGMIGTDVYPQWTLDAELRITRTIVPVVSSMRFER